jgi:hypothetical protein
MQAQDSKQDYQRAGGTSRTVTGRVMPAPSEIPVSNEPDTLIQTFADQKTGNIIKRYRDRLGKVYDVVVGNASKKNGAPAPASNAPTKAGQPNKPASKPPTAPAQPVQATAPKSTYSTYSAKTSTNVPFSFPNSIPTNEAPSFRLLDDRFVPRSEPPVSPVWGPTPYNELTNAALTALGSLIPASAIKTGVQLLNTANNIGTTLRRVTPEMKAGRRAVNDVRDAYRTATQRAREQKDASDVIEWFNKQNK